MARPEARSTRRWSGFASSERGCYVGGMCLICIDLDRSTLKPQEARRALGEMVTSLKPAHVEEVEEKIAAAERAAATEAAQAP